MPVLVQVGAITELEHGGTYPVLIRRPAISYSYLLTEKSAHCVGSYRQARGAGWMVKICCLCAANCSILSKPGHINYREPKL